MAGGAWRPASSSCPDLSRPLISYLRKFYYYDPEEEIQPSPKERGAEPSSQPAAQPLT